MFNESSFSDLYQSAVKAFPNTTKRQHATQPIVIEELSVTPFVGMKTLFVKAGARNEDRFYNPMILFKNVNYSGKDVKIKVDDGLMYQFSNLSLEDTDIMLRCQCGDFKWRFAWYDKLDKSLYGRAPKKYESKGGPPANPLELPGMCKHLMKTIDSLHEMGVFLPS